VNTPCNAEFSNFTTTAGGDLATMVQVENLEQIHRPARRAHPWDRSPQTPPSPPVRHTSASNLRPQFSLPFIAFEAYLDQWIAALR
jgi:hypothetical protein